MTSAQHDEGRADRQTEAQWAMRWFGVVAMGLLLGSVPFFHVVWHGAFGKARPPVEVRSQESMPEWSWSSFLDGHWAPAVERHLKEASPVIWLLRGAWNELRYAAGIYQSSSVYNNGSGWFFSRHTLHPSWAEFVQRGPSRRAMFESARDRARQLGLELVVSIVPDKAGVHADEAYRDGLVPEVKMRMQKALRDELAALDIPSADLWSVMRVARQVAPATPLYYERDTHWRPEGALVAARATAALLEGRFAERLGPREEVAVVNRERVRVVPDRVAAGGFLVRDLATEAGLPLSLTAGPVTAFLAEEMSFYGIARMRDGRQESVEDEEWLMQAQVMLAGTSFSEVSGQKALMLALGRPVTCVVNYGASGIQSLRELLAARARDGGRETVLVWEIVERGFLEDGWANPQL